MGGDLYFYMLTKNGIVKSHRHKIKDSRPLKMYNFIDNIKMHQDPNCGMKIQKNTGSPDVPEWEDKFYLSNEGTIITEEMIAKKLQITDGTDEGILIDAKTRKIDFSKFDTVAGKLTAENLILNGMDIGEEFGEIYTHINEKGQIINKAENKQQFIDQYGLNPDFIKRYPNKIYNSSFEVYNPISLKPDYWSAGIIERNSAYDNSVSLKISQGLIVQQEEINGEGMCDPSWWNLENSRVSFRHKGGSGGSIRVSVHKLIDDMSLIITDNSGEPEVSGTFLEYPGALDWNNGFCTFYVVNPSSGKIYLRFENISNQNVYLDAIQIEPDFTHKHPSFYTHGPKSLNIMELSTGELLEYDSMDWSPIGAEFILNNMYLEKPNVKVEVEIDANDEGNTGIELNTANFKLVPIHVKENIMLNGVSTSLYSKIQVIPRGSSIPSIIGSGIITIQAVCNGHVNRATL